MKLAVVAVGSLKERYFREACAEYSKRMSSMRPVEILEVPEEPVLDESMPAAVERSLEKEGLRILRCLKPDDFPVALAPEGRPLDSPGFAALIDPMANPDAKRMVFVVGSSHGLAPAVHGKCKLTLSFGPMTFPHQLARVMLLEQIYRGQMILQGRAYHK